MIFRRPMVLKKSGQIWIFPFCHIRVWQTDRKLSDR